MKWPHELRIQENHFNHMYLELSNWDNEAKGSTTSLQHHKICTAHRDNAHTS